MRWLLIIHVLFLISQAVQAQSKYWVFLTDKEGVSFNPHEYFTQGAIQRRQKHNVPLDQETDYPVKSSYKKKVGKIADSMLYASRWLNAVACYLQPTQKKRIANLDFVQTIRLIDSPDIRSLAMDNTESQALSKQKSKLLEWQTKSLDADVFWNNSVKGKGVRIAIFDTGFPGVDEHPAFQHLLTNDLIVDTRDFVQGNNNVYRGFHHGTMVLSCIAGRYGDTLMGLAPEAEFLLARTERLLGEGIGEEENWVAAMEWADRMGADIINSSLGYTYHRYFPEDMDGQTSLIARTANIAARKGILVINGAGNAGTNNWKIIGSPADADSVLTVGGISPWKGYQASFSSYGPTADQRLKPNVSAYGHVIAANPNGYTQTQGTSFSSPLVAGFAACLLQQNPNWTNMQLKKKIEESASLYPYFDYAHGYGVPSASYLIGQHDSSSTFNLKKDNQKLQVRIKDNYWQPSDTITPVLETNATTIFQSNTRYNPKAIGHKRPLLYYHTENQEGYLNKYSVIRVTDPNPLSIDLATKKPGQILRIHYKGTTKTHKIKKK